MASEPRIVVVTVSTRAASGEYIDRSGPAAVAALRELGYDVPDAIVVADGEPVRDALMSAIEDGVDIVITSGGTGLSPDDRTPEITRQVVDREVPGVMEAIRQYGREEGVATAALSRGSLRRCWQHVRRQSSGFDRWRARRNSGARALACSRVDQLAGADH